MGCPDRSIAQRAESSQAPRRIGASRPNASGRKTRCRSAATGSRRSSLPPINLSAGPNDKFSDVAVDGQYQYIGDAHIVSAQGTFIRERQTLDEGVALGEAANQHNDLKTARLAGSYYFRRTYGGALGVFSTTGSSDSMLYQAAPVFGFETNSPNSNGWTGELSYIPWQNVKILLQYTRYHKFNGASMNYDGTGRNAKDNNTIYLLGWLAF